MTHLTRHLETKSFRAEQTCVLPWPPHSGSDSCGTNRRQFSCAKAACGSAQSSSKLYQFAGALQSDRLQRSVDWRSEWRHGTAATEEMVALPNLGSCADDSSARKCGMLVRTFSEVPVCVRCFCLLIARRLKCSSRHTFEATSLACLQRHRCLPAVVQYAP